MSNNTDPKIQENGNVEAFRAMVDLIESANNKPPHSNLKIVISTSQARGLLSEIERLQRQVEQMTETLEFYEEEGNYLEHIIGWGPEIPVVKDGGKRARASLSHLKG